MPPAKLTTSNLLLRSLTAEQQKRLAPDLQPVELENRKILLEAGGRLDGLYFPERGTLVSLLSLSEEGDVTEVGITGFEGFTGVNALLGGETSPHQHVVQSAGRALSIPGRALLAHCDKDRALHKQLLQYVDFLLAQVSQTALCNRMHNVEERLSRWLLLSHDRVQNHELALTHETLANMLGTRRSTVSLVAATLQQAGLIRYHRGTIEILDREGLEGSACRCYATIRKHFRQLYPDQKVG